MSKYDGRWDLMVDVGGEAFPSWLEISGTGGRLVGRVGSARALREVQQEESRLRFSLPPQYESRSTDLEFEGRIVDGQLVGETTSDDGRRVGWVGLRAPDLIRDEPEWGSPVELIGSDLRNWQPRDTELSCNWSVSNGLLVNASKGCDLVSTEKFSDFHLVAEYCYPPGSNSGIYLRGRYEFQIVDDFASGEHGVGNSGAIYGFLAPCMNAVRRADEWNRVELTLVGRVVTVKLNDEFVVRQEEIPGITGGALDSSEGEPGPLLLQGDHGPVSFRRLSVQRP